ncbi:MAG: exosortase/archaeosortase family protein [Candidatus Diapherotrites archaeon]|uniref:Exosortase/archaeosortase family protein n=1 Tax=Candidatus Iainarchaeum sp. TaxID=3101447 RepID=A0A8T4L9E5_9ARCH|nr:exosortase/archaeosortase family protein [Candidatus Diapherotrites archaeon]
MQFRFSKAELRKAGKFLAGFVAAFFALNFLARLVPLEAIEGLVAGAALAGLNFFGVNGVLLAGEPVLLQVEGLALPVAISYLCTGLLETIVLVSAVLASFGIPWRERVKGAGLGILISFIFNIIRIDGTILMIKAQGLVLGELTHDLFFRAFLFLSIAGYYAWWFRRSTRQRTG